MGYHMMISEKPQASQQDSQYKSIRIRASVLQLVVSISSAFFAAGRLGVLEFYYVSSVFGILGFTILSLISFGVFLLNLSKQCFATFFRPVLALAFLLILISSIFEISAVYKAYWFSFAIVLQMIGPALVALSFAMVIDMTHDLRQMSQG